MIDVGNLCGYNVIVPGSTTFEQLQTFVTNGKLTVVSSNGVISPVTVVNVDQENITVALSYAAGMYYSMSGVNERAVVAPKSITMTAGEVFPIAFEEMTAVAIRDKVTDDLTSTMYAPSGTAVKNYVSEQLSIYQTKSDETLTTTDKTVVGAINELLTKIQELETKNQELESRLAALEGSN